MLLFLNISFGEIAFVFLIVLILFGPKSIPVIARTLGRTIRQIKDASQEIQREIRESAAKTLDQSSVKEDLEQLKDPFKE
jgi:sec-independent protein translocase protein TatA